MVPLNLGVSAPLRESFTRFGFRASYFVLPASAGCGNDFSRDPLRLGLRVSCFRFPARRALTVARTRVPFRPTPLGDGVNRRAASPGESCPMVRAHAASRSILLRYSHIRIVPSVPDYGRVASHSADPQRHCGPMFSPRVLVEFTVLRRNETHVKLRPQMCSQAPSAAAMARTPLSDCHAGQRGSVGDQSMHEPEHGDDAPGDRAVRP